MSKTVVTDGTEQAERAEACEEREHVIVIADRGWIFEGRMSEPYRLADAHVVRRWFNGLGIGGLQQAAHRDEYVLDALPGGVEVAERAVIAVLPVTEW